MQNQNQDDSKNEESKEVAIVAMLTDIPPLPPMTPMFSTLTIFVIVLMCFLSIFSFLNGKWFVGIFDVGIVAVLIFMSYKTHKFKKKVHRTHNNLISIRKIMTTPTIIEEGNSMILTFLRPSDRLMNEMNKEMESILKKKS